MTGGIINCSVSTSAELVTLYYSKCFYNTISWQFSNIGKWEKFKTKMPNLVIEFKIAD